MSSIQKLYLSASISLSKENRDFLTRFGIIVESSERDVRSDELLGSQQPSGKTSVSIPNGCCLLFNDKASYSIVMCYNGVYDIAVYYDDLHVAIITIANNSFFINKLYNPVTKTFIGMDD